MIYSTGQYRVPAAIPGAPHRPPHCGTPVFIAAVGGPIIFNILVSLATTVISAGVSMAFASFTCKPRRSALP